jgi:L-ascorbate metabolism protein UlaG (beta-lactamase superfamily)
LGSWAASSSIVVCPFIITERYHAPTPAQNRSARPFGLSRRDRREYNPLPTANPNFTAHFRASARNAMHIPLTHGHDDHIGDTVRIARKTDAEIVVNFDLRMWPEGQGAQKINSGNTGGKIPRGNFSVGITDAHHSASVIDGGPVKRYFDFKTVIPR